MRRMRNVAIANQVEEAIVFFRLSFALSSASKEVYPDPRIASYKLYMVDNQLKRVSFLTGCPGCCWRCCYSSLLFIWQCCQKGCNTRR